jgi:hypothetical protein
MSNGPFDQTTRSPSLSLELARAEADIARTRAQVSRSVSALRQAMAESTDWREWVRRRPGVALAAAFTIGFIWGNRR